MLRSGPLVFRAHWPSVHQDKGADVTTEILVWLANMMESALQWTDFDESAQLFPEYRKYIGLGAWDKYQFPLRGRLLAQVSVAVHAAGEPSSRNLC